MRLNLVTFNTLGTPFLAPNIAARYKKTAEILNDSDVEVACLQEVFSYYNKFWFDRGLPNFPYRVSKTFPFGIYGGLTIYSKLPLTFYSYYVYSYPKGVTIPPYTKIAHSGILISKFKEIPLTLATTHLSSDIETHDLKPVNRLYTHIKSQAEQAADVLNKLSKEQSALLIGDFNINKGNELYKQFLKSTNAKDIFEHETEPTYSFDRVPYPFPTKNKSRIDYMFYKGEQKLKTENAGLIFKDKVEFSKNKSGYLSDHIGLKITLHI